MTLGRRGGAFGSSSLPRWGVATLDAVTGKAERRAAQEAVAAYYQAQLGALVERAGEAADRFRAGELDAYEADELLFQYSRATKELWKFCNYPNIEVAARIIADDPPTDWWERGEPKRR